MKINRGEPKDLQDLDLKLIGLILKIKLLLLLL